MTRWLRAALLVLLASACDPEDFGFRPEDALPDRTCVGAPVDMAGVWALSGRGRRSGCQDDLLNDPSFALRGEGIPVVQSDGRLSLAAEIPGFELTGRIRGACVEATTTETVEGRTTRYTWELVVDDAIGREADGRFTGSGPGTCETEGTFTLRW